MEATPFDNPFLQFLGARLVHWAEDVAEFQLPLRAELMNRIGQVQGGVLCALLDAAAGYAGVYVPPGEPKRNGVTLSLATNFLAAGHGATLIAMGMVQRKGNSVFFARSEVRLESGLVLATAIGSFKFVRSTEVA